MQGHEDHKGGHEDHYVEARIIRSGLRGSCVNIVTCIKAEWLYQFIASLTPRRLQDQETKSEDLLHN
jgi:hypothetical protein